MPPLQETRHLSPELRNAAADCRQVTLTGAEAARVVALVQRLQTERDEFARLLVEVAVAEAEAAEEAAVRAAAMAAVADVRPGPDLGDDPDGDLDGYDGA